jgi:hypothetical protein
MPCTDSYIPGMNAMSAFVFLVGFLGFANVGFAVDACPWMQGKYACPATPTQAALKFEVVQTRMPDRTHYAFHYEGFPDDVAEASPSGIVNHYANGDDFIFCVDRSLIYVPKQNDKGSLQQSFRGPKGEYVVKVRGKEVIRCSLVADSTAQLDNPYHGQ